MMSDYTKGELEAEFQRLEEIVTEQEEYIDELKEELQETQDMLDEASLTIDKLMSEPPSAEFFTTDQPPNGSELFDRAYRPMLERWREVTGSVYYPDFEELADWFIDESKLADEAGASREE
jgi:uncharacterized coiled-coil protein SlyX